MEELTILINRTLHGDLKAYGDLGGRFQDMALGYAYSLLGDFHLAEDAAQEAFIRAYLDLAKLAEPAAFRAGSAALSSSTAIASAGARANPWSRWTRWQRSARTTKTPTPFSKSKR